MEYFKTIKLAKAVTILHYICSPFTYSNNSCVIYQEAKQTASPALLLA